MATIWCRSLDTGKKLPVRKERVLPLLVRIERDEFARIEALDFEDELKKRNVELTLVMDTSTADIGVAHLAAYLLLAFHKPGRTVLIHKICVHPMHRNQGIATKLLEETIQKLSRQGCARLQLWVDQNNAFACSLYKNLGFKQVSKVSDYYGYGRTGLQMILYLV